MLGGHIIQTQQYHNSQGMGNKGHFSGTGGITVIKENSIAVGNNLGHHMIQGSSH